MWFARGHDEPTDGDATRRRLCGGLFGVAWWLLAWLPFVPIRDQWLTPRTFHIPMLGAAIALACLLDCILTGTRRRHLLARFLVGAATVMLAWPCAISLLGWQVLYRNRFRADERQMAELIARVPSPPPGTVFVPLEDAYRAAKTTHLLFDVGLISWTGSASTVNAAVSHAYGRTDLQSSHKDFWNPVPVTPLGAQGLVYGMPMTGYSRSDGTSLVPWANVITFCIDDAGHVVLVDTVRLRSAKGEETLVHPPLVVGAKPGPSREYIFAESPR
jgi:hypothetical protein